MKSQFKKLDIIWEKLLGPQDAIPIDFIWKKSMTAMLGKTYKLLPKAIGKKNPDIIALPSHDGSLNSGAFLNEGTYGKRNWADGNWYFPKTVVTKIEKPKLKNGKCTSNEYIRLGVIHKLREQYFGCF